MMGYNPLLLCLISALLCFCVRSDQGFFTSGWPDFLFLCSADGPSQPVPFKGFYVQESLLSEKNTINPAKKNVSNSFVSYVQVPHPHAPVVYGICFRILLDLSLVAADTEQLRGTVYLQNSTKFHEIQKERTNFHALLQTNQNVGSNGIMSKIKLVYDGTKRKISNIKLSLSSECFHGDEKSAHETVPDNESAKESTTVRVKRHLGLIDKRLRQSTLEYRRPKYASDNIDSSYSQKVKNGMLGDYSKTKGSDLSSTTFGGHSNSGSNTDNLQFRDYTPISPTAINLRGVRDGTISRRIFGGAHGVVQERSIISSGMPKKPNPVFLSYKDTGYQTDTSATPTPMTPIISPCASPISNETPEYPDTESPTVSTDSTSIPATPITSPVPSQINDDESLPSTQPPSETTEPRFPSTPMTTADTSSLPPVTSTPIVDSTPSTTPSTSSPPPVTSTPTATPTVNSTPTPTPITSEETNSEATISDRIASTKSGQNSRFDATEEFLKNLSLAMVVLSILTLILLKLLSVISSTTERVVNNFHYQELGNFVGPYGAAAASTVSYGLLNPYPTEILDLVRYVQFMACLSMLESNRTVPAVFMNFMDAFSWVNFVPKGVLNSIVGVPHFENTTGSNHTVAFLSTNTVEVPGIVLWANRVNIDPKVALLAIILVFSLILGVFFIIGLVYFLLGSREKRASYHEHREGPQCSQSHTGKSYFELANSSIGLITSLCSVVILPVVIFATFELTIKGSSRGHGGLILPISVLLIFSLCIVFVSLFILRRDEEELAAVECQTRFGSLYMNFNYENRLFFVLLRMMDVYNGVCIGAIRHIPVQLVLLLLSHAMLLAYGFFVQPFVHRFVYTVFVLIFLLRMLNLSLTAALIYSPTMDETSTTILSYSIQGINTVVFTMVAARLFICIFDKIQKEKQQREIEYGKRDAEGSGLLGIEFANKLCQQDPDRFHSSRERSLSIDNS